MIQTELCYINFVYTRRKLNEVQYAVKHIKETGCQKVVSIAARVAAEITKVINASSKYQDTTTSS